MSAQDQAKQAEAIALAVRDYHVRLLRALASEHTRIHDVTILETKAPTAECEALTRDIAANLERIASDARAQADEEETDAGEELAASERRAKRLEKERDQERERAEKAEADLTALRADLAYNLVARAVELGCDVRVEEDFAGWLVAALESADLDEVIERDVPSADVPAVLSRMLDEVAERKGAAK